MKRIDGLLKVWLMVVMGTVCLWGETHNRRFINSSWQYGIIDDDFNVIITPKYKFAGNYSEGAVNVELSQGEWALIDKNENVLCKVKAKRLSSLHNGWAIADTESNERFYINKKGKVMGNYGFASEFDEGKAYVRPENSRGYFINSKGEKISEDLPYRSAVYAENGLWLVYCNGEGVINSNYQEIVPCARPAIDIAGEGYFVSMLPEDLSRCCFLDSKGKRVGSVTFKHSSKVYNGIAFIKKPESSDAYIYDLKNDKLTGPLQNCERMNKESKNIVLIKKIEDKWKYVVVNRNNEQICPVYFDEFMDESDEMLWMQKDGKNFIVNSKGMYWSPAK